MTEMIDWGQAAELLEKKDMECEQLKSHCRTLLDRQDRDTTIIEEQSKKITTLKKNQDPKLIKAYMEVQTKVMA